MGQDTPFAGDSGRRDHISVMVPAVPRSIPTARSNLSDRARSFSAYLTSPTHAAHRLPSA